MCLSVCAVYIRASRWSPNARLVAGAAAARLSPKLTRRARRTTEAFRKGMQTDPRWRLYPGGVPIHVAKSTRVRSAAKRKAAGAALRTAVAPEATAPEIGRPSFASTTSTAACTTRRPSCGARRCSRTWFRPSASRRSWCTPTVSLWLPRLARLGRTCTSPPTTTRRVSPSPSPRGTRSTTTAGPCRGAREDPRA